jgi:hypothetical protein
MGALSIENTLRYRDCVSSNTRRVDPLREIGPTRAIAIRFIIDAAQRSEIVPGSI